MEELFQWVLTREFTNGHKYDWVVLATEEEIEKLMIHEKGNHFITKDAYYRKDNDNLVATHQFDSDGRLWCRTPIRIR